MAELREAVRAQAGLDVLSLVPAGGESGAAFWLHERGGTSWLLKTTREPVSSLRALEVMTGRLRERGYPAPRIRAAGQVRGGRAFWIQERMPGHTLSAAGGDPDGAALSRLLPELFRLNEAQAWASRTVLVRTVPCGQLRGQCRCGQCWCWRQPGR